MRFLLDANIPRSVLELLLQQGHLAEHVIDTDLASADDDAIAKHAAKTDATLITRDLDFSDVRRYSPQATAGIVVLRVRDDMIASDIAKVFARFLLALGDVENLRSRLAIVESERFRLRPALN
jgi:predicted nuclease of predicted toxin-antitoxin system